MPTDKKIWFNSTVRKRLDQYSVDVSDLKNVIFQIEETGDTDVRHQYRRHKLVNAHYKNKIAIHYRNDLVILYQIVEDTAFIYDAGTHRQVLRW